MNPELRDLLLLALDFLLTVGGPIVGAIVAASLLSAFFERLVGVRDMSLGLSARLGAAVVTTMFLWDRLLRLLADIGRLAFR